MRYRLLASYQGAPYEVGVGPAESDVVLFAACPPPEDLQFEPATGHWRKRVDRSDVQTLHESRPIGMFRGERCVVLDDLGERLHIVYLGHDALRAEQLGYWEVDRGVFELITPRQEVTDIVEQRLPFPSRGQQPPAGHGAAGYAAETLSGPPVSLPFDTLQAGNSGPSQPEPGLNGFAPAAAGHGGTAQNGHGYPHDHAPAVPPGPVMFAPDGTPPGAVAPGMAPPGPAPTARSSEISLPPVAEVPLPLEAEARRASAAARREQKGQPAHPAARPDSPPQPQPQPQPQPSMPQASPVPAGPIASQAQPVPPAPAPQAQAVSQAQAPEPAQAAPPPDLAQTAPSVPPAAQPQASPPAQPSQPTPSAQGARLLQPPTGPLTQASSQSLSISEPPVHAHLGADTLPPSAVPSWTPQAPPQQPPQAQAPQAHAPQAQAPPQLQPHVPVPVPPDPQPSAAMPVPAPTQGPADPSAPLQVPTGLPHQESLGEELAQELTAGPGASPPAAGPGAEEVAQPAAAPRRRRATRRRMPTQRIFSDLAAQAAIPATAYAIGEDVDGAMCLMRTDEGFEVFNSAAGARHEVRLFDDEESAYFYLFGVLVAESVRTGDLAPRR